MSEPIRPIVLITSFPPRLCGIGTFAEEAVEFIRKHVPEREVYIICHTDGCGQNVFPLIDMSRPDWYEPVIAKVRELDPYAVHIEHEYGLYEYVNAEGRGDLNEGFLTMLDRLSDVPTIVEPHTIHGRMKDTEEIFVRRLCEKATIVLFKCHYQRWRLDWTFRSHGWEVPQNITIIPHGARPDRGYPIHEVPDLKVRLGLSQLNGSRICGMVGWIQNNKRWDIVTDVWEEVRDQVLAETGESWILLAAGEMRDPNHRPDYDSYTNSLRLLEEKGAAHFFKFIPRGDLYYQVMAIADFIALPSIDETQSGTLARVIALNKPYVTTAPLEGLTAQTLESGGGLLFTNRDLLKKNMIRLMVNEELRLALGSNLRRYLENVVSWDVVAEQYLDAYEKASDAKHNSGHVVIPPEF
jgi:1,2-diacylglycerol 3-alpha-glucosyltransferase